MESSSALSEEKAESAPAKRAVRPGPDLREWSIAALIFAAVTIIRLLIVSVMTIHKDGEIDAVLGKWDSKHYIDIAEWGYFESEKPVAPGKDPVHYIRLAFFPLFPTMLRAVHEITRLDYLHAGILLNAALGVVMTAGAMAVAKHCGAELRGRIAVAILVVGAPMGITYSMAYSEALFGALSFWGLWAILQKHWWLAGILVFLTGLTRLTAADLMLVFGMAVLFTGLRDWRAWVSVALCPWGMLGYLWWSSSHTKDIGGYFGMQQKGWHSQFDFGRATFDFLVHALMESREAGYMLSAFAIIAAGLWMLFTVRALPWQAWLFSAAVTVNVLLSDGIMHSRPRLLLPAILLMAPSAMALTQLLTKRQQWGTAIVWVVFGAWFSGYMLNVMPWAI